MKVLRITTELNFGGIEKVFELHAKHHNKSYELVFVALGKGGRTEKVIKELGYRVIVLNAQKVTVPSLGLFHLLTQVIREEKPDVVHSAGAEANFHVTLVAKLLGVKKIICEEIGIPSHSGKAKLVFRGVYKLADQVIAISKAVENFLISSKEVPGNKVSLIYNPVDEIYEKYDNVREDFSFTVVARLEPVKNLPFLIEVFSEVLLKIPKAKLNIIGDGRQKQLLQEQIEKKGLTNHIILKGFIPDPYPELSRSTFFVLPSLYEGFGLACIEAIQAGNLVICTNSGGIPEFITEGEQGFLFDPRSKSSMIMAIEKALILPKAERENIVKSAKDKVKEMFSHKLYTEQLKTLYY